MEFGKKSKVSPIASTSSSTTVNPIPARMQRRRSLIEDYYAWRHNEFEAALVEAAKKEALHHTPPPSPVYERRLQPPKADGKSFERCQKKKLLEEVGSHELDIFKPNKKKFTMYPAIPHTPDETPSITPNLSSHSLSSSHHHHSSFPHLPDIDESEHEDEDDGEGGSDRPNIFNFKSTSSLAKGNKEAMDNKSGFEKMMERKLLDPKKRTSTSNGGAGPQPKKREKSDELDLESGSRRIKEMKYSKWEIAQEFVPWVMIVTSIIQIALFIADRDEFFQLFVFAPNRTIELWRFVTYSFLHTNFTHLALNIVIQILLAIPLEFEQNHGRVAAVYYGGTVLGGIGVMLFGPQILVVGASAGVYSLLLSHIPHIILNKRTIRYRNVRLGVVFFLCLCDLIHTIVHFSSNGNSEPRIGVWAHIFGAIGGLLLGTTFYTFIDYTDGCPENRPRHYVRVRQASIVLLILILLAAIVYGLVA